MTLDPEHHRAFLSCEENNLMTVFDLDKHEPIAFLPMADGPDVIKFDPGLTGFMPRATAEPSPFFTRMIRTTTGRSRTFGAARGPHAGRGSQDASGVHAGTGRRWQAGGANGGL